MLSKQRCPHTGIVNFFTDNDPFVSVGSIMRQGDRDEIYCWRWYDAASTISGLARDMSSAEERLRRVYRRGAGRARQVRVLD